MTHLRTARNLVWVDLGHSLEGFLEEAHYGKTWKIRREAMKTHTLNYVVSALNATEKGFLQLSIMFPLSLFFFKPYFLSVVLNWMEDCLNSVCAQSCPTPCDPTDCSLPGSSVYGIVQAGILERGAISFSRGSSDLGIEPMYSTIADGFFTTEPAGKPKSTVLWYKTNKKIKWENIRAKKWFKNV